MKQERGIEYPEVLFVTSKTRTFMGCPCDRNEATCPKNIDGDSDKNKFCVLYVLPGTCMLDVVQYTCK